MPLEVFGEVTVFFKVALVYLSKRINYNSILLNDTWN